MRLFSVKFFMLSAKKFVPREKPLSINMQMYAPNSCAGQKHRGRWRLISGEVFDSSHLNSPFYVNRELNVRSAGSY